MRLSRPSHPRLRRDCHQNGGSGGIRSGGIDVVSVLNHGSWILDPGSWSLEFAVPVDDTDSDIERPVHFPLPVSCSPRPMPSKPGLSQCVERLLWSFFKSQHDFGVLRVRPQTGNTWYHSYTLYKISDMAFLSQPLDFTCSDFVYCWGY